MRIVHHRLWKRSPPFGRKPQDLKRLLLIYGIYKIGTADAIPSSMISLSRLTNDVDGDHTPSLSTAVAAQPKCYAVTIFTHQFREVRDFYVDILNAHVLSEVKGRVCELELAGMPICLRHAEHGEMPSYFHLHLALKNQDAVLSELRRRGIIVTSVGPFTNFRDPEGRVIKLSEDRIAVA